MMFSIPKTLLPAFRRLSLILLGITSLLIAGVSNAGDKETE